MHARADGDGPTELGAQLSGASRLYPIIGDPLAAVQSPARLTATLARRGHHGLCVPLQVPDGALDVVMAALSAAPNVAGVLVTMPHKRAAAAHCATTTARAARLGVVSVVRREPDGSWHGDVLDGVAFLAAQQAAGAQAEGARALLVGAGGAGSAIALALLDAGVGHLRVADTDAHRLAGLVRALGEDAGARLQVQVLPRGGPGADPRGVDLVFNATPLGMAAGDGLPVQVGHLGSSTFVGDVVSGRGVTPLLAAARAAGCSAVGGDAMVEAVQEVMAAFLLHEARAAGPRQRAAP